MHPYPHTYNVAASGGASGPVSVTAAGLPEIRTEPPPQFDGPGGAWSPESLLCAAVADCFILSFRAYARVARFEWLQLECQVEGTLERVERAAQFTAFRTHATLTVPPDAAIERAHQLLEQAEQGCLIANSLRGSRALEAQVLVRQPGVT
ncbi:MAG: OsmC family protein [Gammaproteobacteria bacterium]|nr:OsmC family protein [Gammaproteobacteria bacterium]